MNGVLTNSDWLILNVDDQQAMRYAKTRDAAPGRALKSWKLQNGMQALESVETHAPALILCDIKMPDMSGHEVSRGHQAKTPKHRGAPDLFIFCIGARPRRPASTSRTPT